MYIFNYILNIFFFLKIDRKFYVFIMCCMIFVCVFVCGAEDWTQGFVHAKQVLHFWATSPAPT